MAGDLAELQLIGDVRAVSHVVNLLTRDRQRSVCACVCGVNSDEKRLREGKTGNKEIRVRFSVSTVVLFCVFSLKETHHAKFTFSWFLY